MLKETYKANLKKIPKDAIVIIVMRSNDHMLSPSWRLLNEYRDKKITWNEYVVRFKEEMNNEFCTREMKRIKELSKHKDVYLVCHEKTFPCHRFILMELINSLNEV